jgi:hypothetical protein
MLNKFKNKIRERLLKYTPEQLIKLRLKGYILNSVGTIFAVVFILLFTDFWYFVLAIVFTLIINYSAYIQEWQQLKQIEDYKKIIVEEPEEKSVLNFMENKKNGN